MINDRPTILKVRLDCLYNNYKKLVASSKGKIGLAIVKANSYGLGAKVVVDYLYSKGVRHFAVATLEEALEIKEYAKESMILVLGITKVFNVKYALENNISLCVTSKKWLEEVIEIIEKEEKSNNKLRVHLKLDTGMNRIGVTNEDDMLEIVKLLFNDCIEFEGVFSHYANADGGSDDYDKKQKKSFENFLNLLNRKPKYIHLDNSAGSIKYGRENETFNLMRLGIALYGSYPSKVVKEMNKIELENVISLVSKVSYVKKVEKSEKIGYGCTYEMPETGYIATIPVGYADGVLRRSQGFRVKINNEDCEIVGRVCMDQLMVRCSNKVKEGDEVLFFGELNGNYISLDDFADYQNTISYEITCCLTERVVRKYYIGDVEL